MTVIQAGLPTFIDVFTSKAHNTWDTATSYHMHVITFMGSYNTGTVLIDKHYILQMVYFNVFMTPHVLRTEPPVCEHEKIMIIIFFIHLKVSWNVSLWLVLLWFSLIFIYFWLFEQCISLIYVILYQFSVYLAYFAF